MPLNGNLLLKSVSVKAVLYCIWTFHLSKLYMSSETQCYLSKAIHQRPFQKNVMPITRDLTSVEITHKKWIAEDFLLWPGYQKQIQNNPIQFSHKDHISGPAENTDVNFEPSVTQKTAKGNQ